MFHVDFGARAPGRVVRRFRVPQIEFDIAFFEDILAHNPTHLEAMRTLAELYTRTGRFRAGLQIDRRVVAARPRDPVAHYNLACSLALTGRLDECFQVLRQALRLGYRDLEYMSADSDLDAAQKDPRWQRLFDRIQV
jgi:hypothetical protein